MARRILVAWTLAVGAFGAQAQAEATQDDPAAAAGCSRAFTREIRRVCGSDGTIYTNPSIFEYHKCVGRAQGRELTQMHMTHCDPAFDDTQDL